MNRSFIQTRHFRHIHFSVFRYRFIKNALTGPERFLGILRNRPQVKTASELDAQQKYGEKKSRKNKHYLASSTAVCSEMYCATIY